MFRSVSTLSSSQLPSSQVTGHFVFPPGSSVTPEQRLKTLEEIALAQQAIEALRISEEEDVAKSAEQERLAKEREWEEQLKLKEQRRQKLREREREEALKGEKYWVRCGGILRDEDGRRDYKRTEELRKIVKKEDAELCIIECWKAYETAWTNIISSPDKAVSFADMPWPLPSPPKSLDELRDAKKIADFLFESLNVEHNTTTRRERLRMSLLRWHPDKLGSVLARVPEEELGAVKDGIDAVVISLMKLQEAEKAR